MHATDILAYTYDGAIYHPECTEIDDNDPELSPVFADHDIEYLDSYVCPVCDTTILSREGFES